MTRTQRNKIYDLDEWLSKNKANQSDLAGTMGRDRRKVSDAKKRKHMLIENSKGKLVFVPEMYREAFE